MPIYAYTAVGENGREYRGREEAVSEAALEAKLRKLGHWLASAESVKTNPEVVMQTSTFWMRSVPRRALAEFFLQMSLQLRAGIPLVTALNNQLGENEHPGFRSILFQVTDRVQAGEPLSASMQAHPKAFSPLITNLVRAGEASGKLAETCNQVRLYLEWQDRLIADVRQALTYPAFVLVCTLAFVFLMFTFLVPKFARLLTEMQVPLPVLTQVVMGISHYFVERWWQMLLGCGLSVLAFAVLHKTVPRFGYMVDAIKLKLPVFGGLLRMICLSRFSQNLAVMYQAGIPLLESLGLVKGLVGNRVLEEAIQELRGAVNAGKQMHVAMQGHPVFSRLVVQMVSVGESTGSLGVALENVADYYNEILPRQIKRMFALLEPMMILGLIALVGVVALAIFLPIVSLLSFR